MTVTLHAMGFIKQSCDTYTVLWTQTGGPGVSLSDATSLNPTFDSTTPGIYSFLLTGTDSSGAMATSTTKVTITT